MAATPDAILTMQDMLPEAEKHIDNMHRIFTGVVPDKPHTIRDFLQGYYYQFHNTVLPPFPGVEDPAPTDTVEVHVNHGRWLWQCERCFSGIYAEKPADHPNPHPVTTCVYCPFDGWKLQVFPANADDIEEELLRQPGYRSSAPLRNWHLDWTLDHLRDRTAKAAELGPNPRKLSIGLTHVWSIGERLTAAGMNLWTSDLIDDLAGRNGLIEFENDMRIGGGSGEGMLQLEPRGNNLPSYEGGVSYDSPSKSLRLDAGISGTNREMTFPAAIASDLVDGDVLVRDSTVEGGWLRLPPGGVGTVLTSRGPGLTPHWT